MPLLVVPPPPPPSPWPLPAALASNHGFVWNTCRPFALMMSGLCVRLASDDAARVGVVIAVSEHAASETAPAHAPPAARGRTIDEPAIPVSKSVGSVDCTGGTADHQGSMIGRSHLCSASQSGGGGEVAGAQRGEPNPNTRR